MNLSIHLPEAPVRLRFEKPLSDEELMEFCAQNEALRVERDTNGEIILMSPVNYEGSMYEFNLGMEVGNWARTDGRGRGFGPNSGFTLPDGSMRGPDAAWMSFTRANALTSAQRKTFAPVCPEFIIALRSQSDRLKPLQEKMRMWLTNGAELAWLIDPQRKVVEVYRLNEDPEIHQNPSSVQGSGPVAGFELVLSRIWG